MTVTQEGSHAAVLREAILGGDAQVHIVGVGNELRGDDAAGLALASSLAERLGLNPTPRLTIHVPLRNPEVLISRLCLQGARVVVLDAVEAAKEPGTVVAARLRDTKFGFFATHNVPLKLIPGVSEGDVWLLGVEPASLEVGAGLSPDVLSAVTRLTDEVCSMVEGEG